MCADARPGSLGAWLWLTCNHVNDDFRFSFQCPKVETPMGRLRSVLQRLEHGLAWRRRVG